MTSSHDNNLELTHPLTVVVAMGGHAFIKPGQKGTIDDHESNAREICKQLMAFVERKYNIIITHGNGPQVGSLLLQAEAAHDEVPPFPLDAKVAETEGGMGYILQQALLNELRRRDVRRYVVTMVTQVLVDEHDKAFQNPTKPIGPFMTQEVAEERAKLRGWTVHEDSGRGWRRVVPSPDPKRVIQREMIRDAAQAGHIVVAAGGGGIPIRKREDGDYEGIEAVIDKDLTSSVLATNIGADLLVILTAVDAVYLEYNTKNQQALGAVTLAECKRYIDGGHFPDGSMGPKVEAIYRFLKSGGRRGLITSPEKLVAALNGEAGTHFVGQI